MRKLWFGFIILLLAACSHSKNSEEQSETGQVQEDQPASGNLAESQIADQLQIPWAITKKDSTFYLSERRGTIVSVEETTGEKNRVSVQLNKKLLTEGEGGFLGFELLPNTDLEAVAYHTYEENGNMLNRIVRLQKEPDQWTETAVLLEGIPGANIHNGGRIKLGPDGMLYVTTGDAATPELAQKRDSLAGKILRLEVNGTIPHDNPIPGSAIYSYGHRNSQGLAWDEKGQLFATEHGQSAHDEMNMIEPGKNYGWPIIQGDEEKADMKAPIFHTNGDTWAPSGIAYHKEKLYIGSLRGESVRIYDLGKKKASIFTKGNGRIRDVFIEGDKLYYVTNNTDGRGAPGENDDRLLEVELK